MRPFSTATAVLLASLLATGIAAAQDFDSAGEQQMLARINAMRAAQQLGPLTRNDGLDAAARAHCQDMAAQGALTHVSQTSGTPADRARAAGVTATTIAENVALHRTAEAAHEALLASEAHRANMMSADITHVGLAALRTPQGVYVTQVFAAIAPPAPPAVAAAPVEEPPAHEVPAAPAAPADSGNCFSPLPGVRVCGQIPAPSVERVERPAPVQEEVVEAPVPPPAQVPVAPVAPQPAPTRPLVVQPGSNGTVLIQRTADDTRVEGYWVYGSGRWWYYPMPATAQPGQQLQPDLRVSGPPPGYPEHPFGPPQQAQMPVQPQAWRVAPPSPGFVAPQYVAPQYVPRAQVAIAPGAAFYSVPPPPMMGNPDRSWRRAHSRWERAYRQWMRQQARLRRQAL